MKMFKSLLVAVAVLVSGQTVCAVSEVRRQQAEALKQSAQAEMVRIRTAVLLPFGDDFDSLSIEGKYTSALKAVKDEIARAKTNIKQEVKAQADFNNAYKNNETARHEYLYGQKEKPVFDVPALRSVLAFALKIKTELDRSQKDGLKTPTLAEATEAQ